MHQQLTFGSVCSGIEAASTAWEALGLRADWFSEIEPFPSAVLAHHWPDVSNLGDMTKIATAIRAGEVNAPDILVGGTPCQAFSIAGLREGLSDARGQLTLSYVELANAIDAKRRERGEPESIIVWENVPGVLSSKDNAFGCFLAGLAGESSELQPSGGKWSHAGCVSGPERVIAWRILDAQFFGVAQRRRRVFVIASARTDIDPIKILFECGSVRRDTPPSRSAGKAVARIAGNGIKVGSHWDNPAYPHPTLNQSHNIGGIGQSNQELFSQRGCGIISMAHGQGGAEIKTDDSAPTLTCNHEAPIAAYGIPGNWIGRAPENGGNATEPMHDVAPCLTVADRNRVAYASQPGFAQNGCSDALTAEAIETEKSDSAPCLVLAFAENTRAEVRLVGGDGQIVGALSTGGGKPGQGFPAIAYGFKAGQGAKAGGIGYAEEQAPTLTSASSGTNLAPTILTYSGYDILGTPASEVAKEADVHTPLRARIPGQFENSTVTMVANGMAVRRLTPVECERLQGFPDNHTLIPVDKRKKITADEYAYLRHHRPNITAEEAFRLAAVGPRYKALGNSMAVPVMRRLGEWIQREVQNARSAGDADPDAAIAHVSGNGVNVSEAPGIPPATGLIEEKRRPFLKWAGGKFSVLDELAKYLPPGKRLVEPFVGAGSVFLNFRYPAYLSADVNADLVNLYRQLAGNPDSVIRIARQLVNGCVTNDTFLAIRDEFNGRQAHAVRHAALFLALNRTCFNGLTRYNTAGVFNTGWNKKDVDNYFPEQELHSYASRRVNHEFLCASFEETISRASVGDVIYCDPPYEPLPGKSGFVKYDKGGFHFDRQVELADHLVQAHQRGAQVVITNSGAPKIIELYTSRGFSVHELKAKRNISCKGDTREIAKDVIATLKH